MLMAFMILVTTVIQSMREVKMKVKATADFFFYRNQVLELPKQKFRDLQAGKVVEISGDDFKKYPKCYVEIVEKKEK